MSDYREKDDGTSYDRWRSLGQVVRPDNDSFDYVRASVLPSDPTEVDRLRELVQQGALDEAIKCLKRAQNDSQASLPVITQPKAEAKRDGVPTRIIVMESDPEDVPFPSNHGVREKTKAKMLRSLKDTGEGVSLKGLKQLFKQKESLPSSFQGLERYQAPVGNPVEVMLYPGKPYAIEIHRSEEPGDIPEVLISEVADEYRRAFNNAGNYLVYPDTQETVSPHKVFGYPPDVDVPLEKMDNFDPSTYQYRPGKAKLPPKFWHDEMRTFLNLAEKLNSRADLAVVRDLETKKILGFSIARVTDLRNHFRAEWEDPMEYANHDDPSIKRSFEHFLTSLNDVLAEHPKFFDLLGQDRALDADSQVYCWNALFSDASLREYGVTDDILKAVFGSLPPDRKKLLNVAEVKHLSPADWIYMAVGFVKRYGVLARNFFPSKGDPVLIVARVDEIQRNFTQHSYRALVVEQKLKHKMGTCEVINCDEQVNRTLFVRKHLIPRSLPDNAFRVKDFQDNGDSLMVSIHEISPQEDVEVASGVIYPFEIEDYPSKGMTLRIDIRLNIYNVNGRSVIRRVSMNNPNDPIEQAYSEALRVHRLKGWKS